MCIFFLEKIQKFSFFFVFCTVFFVFFRFLYLTICDREAIPDTSPASPGCWYDPGTSLGHRGTRGRVHATAVDTTMIVDRVQTTAPRGATETLVLAAIWIRNNGHHGVDGGGVDPYVDSPWSPGCPRDVPGSYQHPGDAGEVSGIAFRSQIAKYKKRKKTKKTVQKTEKNEIFWIFSRKNIHIK